MKPVTLDYQTRIHSQRGYIDEGCKGKDLPSFETWKRIRDMFPKECIEWMDLEIKDVNLIPDPDIHKKMCAIVGIPSRYFVMPMNLNIKRPNPIPFNHIGP